MRFLTKEAFQSEGEAKLKLIRAKQSSTQLSTYFVGRMAHYRLHQQIEREMGNKFNLAQYHNAVISHGSIPSEVCLPELWSTETLDFQSKSIESLIFSDHRKGNPASAICRSWSLEGTRSTSTVTREKQGIWIFWFPKKIVLHGMNCLPTSAIASSTTLRTSFKWPRTEKTLGLSI